MAQIKEELVLIDDFSLKIPVIKSILKKGYRVELIPVKDGVKVIQVQRKEIK